MTMITDAPRAVMRTDAECPMVDAGDGVEIAVLQVDIEAGLWVVRNRFQPGVQIDTHKHTGQVFAFTHAGAWKYAEYPEVMTAGSYLYEPAGSIHTLTVPEDNDDVTDVSFAIYGANINLDADGNVISVWDAEFILTGYYALCEAAGLDRPDVIGAP